jgi:hypothetical protein
MYSYIIYNLYSITYYINYYIYLIYLEPIELEMKRKIIIIINFIYKMKINILLFYNEYNKNNFINLKLLKKMEEIERLFFSVYLK